MIFSLHGGLSTSTLAVFTVATDVAGPPSIARRNKIDNVYARARWKANNTANHIVFIGFLPHINTPRAAGIQNHTVKLGDFSTLDECERACKGITGCVMFTWNQHVAPHDCFGYTSKVPAVWAPTSNPHCISGCEIKKVKDCGAPPKPSPSPSPSPTPPMPPPPPAGLPRWVGVVPTPGSNASAGLPVVASAEHITVYNATTSTGL